MRSRYMRYEEIKQIWQQWRVWSSITSTSLFVSHDALLHCQPLSLSEVQLSSIVGPYDVIDHRIMELANKNRIYC